jgi:hypothetical protein
MALCTTLFPHKVIWRFRQFLGMKKSLSIIGYIEFGLRVARGFRGFRRNGLFNNI